MKIIFTIISIIAAGYLAMQTQFVQNIGIDVSDHFNYMMLNDEKEQTDALALVNDSLTNTSESAIQLAVLVANNVQLTDKVNVLEKRLERLLSNEIDLHEQASIVAHAENETFAVNQQSAAGAKARHVNDVLALTKSTQAAMPMVTSVGSIVRSEHGKRVQQQAILRELSQSLELKALISLTQ